MKKKKTKNQPLKIIECVAHAKNQVVMIEETILKNLATKKKILCEILVSLSKNLQG